MVQNWFQVIFLVMLIGYVRAQFTKKLGDSCRLSAGGAGRCEYFDDCDKVSPNPADLCAWESSGDAIVCCPKSENQPISNQFGPISSSTSSNKSKQKCREYSRYRTLGSVSTIYGGVDVDALSQFPHMALLGFDTDNDVEWACGGTIISENFILTAAHCLSNSRNFPVSRVQVGFLDKRNREVFGALQEFRVRNVFVPPERTPPQRYHDIALLQLDKPVRFSNVTFPACLYNEPEVRVPKATATGWGLKEYGDSKAADILQKVSLPFISKEQCEELYPAPQGVRLPRGIDSATQFCAGENGRDACQGDSGGPLQIHDSTGMINIVGITSFGNHCGVSPGVYTKVSHYVPWIENIVWS